MTDDRMDKIVIGAALAAGAVGLYLAYRRPPGIYIGDKLTIKNLSFEHRGPAVANVYVCWGLKDGALIAPKYVINNEWAAGGPFDLAPSAQYKKYSFVPAEDFDVQPILELTEALITKTGIRYDTRVWFTTTPETLEDRLWEGMGPPITVED